MRIWTTRNSIFATAARVFEVQPDMCDNRQQACPFPAGVFFSGEVEHVVHLIRWNLNSCLCHCGTTWQPSRHLFCLNWVLYINFVVSFLSPTNPHRSLILPPCPSVMCCGVWVCALCWLGPFRRVDWFWRSLCSPPPPALFLAFCPSSVSVFFFLLPFRVVPAPAGCVCV